MKASIIQMGREVFQQHQVCSEIYSRLINHFDNRDQINIIKLMSDGMNSLITGFIRCTCPHDRKGLLSDWIKILTLLSRYDSARSATFTREYSLSGFSRQFTISLHKVFNTVSPFYTSADGAIDGAGGNCKFFE